ncbi:hypothetical protein [Mycobacterium riyadhense]
MLNGSACATVQLSRANPLKDAATVAIRLIIRLFDDPIVNALEKTLRR